MCVLCINLYACLLDNSSEPGTVSTPLIPTLGMQRQIDFFKSEANQLGLLSDFQDSQGCVERLLPHKNQPIKTLQYPVSLFILFMDLFILLFYVYEYCLSVCTCAHVCPQRLEDSIGFFETATTVCSDHHVGAATLLFCKRSKYS